MKVVKCQPNVHSLLGVDAPNAFSVTRVAGGVVGAVDIAPGTRQLASAFWIKAQHAHDVMYVESIKGFRYATRCKYCVSVLSLM